MTAYEHKNASAHEQRDFVYKYTLFSLLSVTLQGCCVFCRVNGWMSLVRLLACSRIWPIPQNTFCKFCGTIKKL